MGRASVRWVPHHLERTVSSCDGHASMSPPSHHVIIPLGFLRRRKWKHGRKASVRKSRGLVPDEGRLLSSRIDGRWGRERVFPAIETHFSQLRFVHKTTALSRGLRGSHFALMYKYLVRWARDIFRRSLRGGNETIKSTEPCSHQGNDLPRQEYRQKTAVDLCIVLSGLFSNLQTARNVYHRATPQCHWHWQGLVAPRTERIFESLYAFDVLYICEHTTCCALLRRTPGLAYVLTR